VTYDHVRFWHLADKRAAPAFVRFWIIADKVAFLQETVCPLMTQSGHSMAAVFRPKAVARGRCFRNPWHYSVDIWKYWTAIEAPIFIIRGADSDLLPADLAREMVRCNSRAKVHTIEGCGHAPPLMNLERIRSVANFLLS
jgi:pimeloyl-ACP methyl ester carboxylesterase